MRECRSAGAAGSPQALAEEVPGVARHTSLVLMMKGSFGYLFVSPSTGIANVRSSERPVAAVRSLSAIFWYGLPMKVFGFTADDVNGLRTPSGVVHVAKAGWSPSISPLVKLDWKSGLGMTDEVSSFSSAIGVVVCSFSSGVPCSSQDSCSSQE